MDSNQVEGYTKTLLTPVKDLFGERVKAAKILESCPLDIKAFNALYTICVYPDVFAIEDGLLNVVGQSLGNIISKRDLSQEIRIYHKMDPKYFDGFHFLALRAALNALNQDQIQRVYEYVVDNPYCTEALTIYFYQIAFNQALKLSPVDHYGAILNASNAIRLFKRFRNEEKRLIEHYKNVVMNIIAVESNVIVLPLFFFLLKNMDRFAPPETDLEKYEQLHIHILTKLACVNYTMIQPLFITLKNSITETYPDDQPFYNVLELLLKGAYRDANKATELIRTEQINNSERFTPLSFYECWYFTVNWLIKERIFTVF